MALGCTGIRTCFANNRNLWMSLQCLTKYFKHGQAVSIVSQLHPTKQQSKTAHLRVVAVHLFQKVAKRTLPSKSELLNGAVLKASKGWRQSNPMVIVLGCSRMPHNWQTFTKSSSLFKSYLCTDHLTHRTAVSELLPKLEKLRLELYQTPDIQLLQDLKSLK